MKTKIITAILVTLLSFLATDIFAQETKLTKKEKREIKRIESNNKFTETINSGAFKFNIISIDTDFAQTLSYIELRGSYMLYVRDKELTVLLPIGGPNVFRGNAATLREPLRFTTRSYNVALSTTKDKGMVATIRAKDPRSNNEFVFTITNNSGAAYLMAYIPGLDRVKYKGHFSKLK